MLRCNYRANPLFYNVVKKGGKKRKDEGEKTGNTRRATFAFARNDAVTRPDFVALVSTSLINRGKSPFWLLDLTYNKK